MRSTDLKEAQDVRRRGRLLRSEQECDKVSKQVGCRDEGEEGSTN